MKCARAERRLECFADQEIPDPRERIPYRKAKCFCASGKLHTRADAYQQRILKERSEPFERVAHRRLGEGNPVCSSTDAGLFQERFQRDEKIQIKRS
jgi:hypothetical protein